jgi:hypothetical protein
MEIRWVSRSGVDGSQGLKDEGRWTVYCSTFALNIGSRVTVSNNGDVQLMQETVVTAVNMSE